ncbi:MAG: hypothetical protein AAGE92_13525, partial [Cyanobacteria bacterium P01_G01_bin.4]
MSPSENERRRRLSNMLSQIAPNASLECLAEELRHSQEIAKGSERLEARTSSEEEDEAFALDSLQAMTQGGVESIDIEQRESLEAIIHRRYRPALFIEGDSYKRGPAPWNELLEGVSRSYLESSIPSVGRIELPQHP